jgi:hypothetical protein
MRFLLRDDSTVVELTSRHRITEIGWDAGEHAVVVVVEITDPQTSRPVDVRFDITADGAEGPSRSRHLGSLSRDGTTIDVYGTYLGVVADEN